MARLREAQQRDAFEQFYRAYFPRVYAFSVRAASDPEAARALTRVIFERALQELHRFDGSVSLAAWMLGVARAERARAGRPLARVEPLPTAQPARG